MSMEYDDPFADPMDIDDEVPQQPCLQQDQEQEKVFKFVLPPEIANFPPFSPPFRFLELPPELRNAIYGEAFASGAHTLTPPNITRINRQLRNESLGMFYNLTSTFQVPLTTPGQITALLKWLSNDGQDRLKAGKAIEFIYTDHRSGETKVRLERDEVNPAAQIGVMDRLSPEMKLAGQNLYQPPPSRPRTNLHMVYDACIGLPDVEELHFCRTFREHFDEPSERFMEVVEERGGWTCYQLSVEEERHRRRCYCSELLKPFAEVFAMLDGEEAEKEDWRKMAMHVYQLHLKGRTRGLGLRG